MGKSVIYCDECACTTEQPEGRHDFGCVYWTEYVANVLDLVDAAIEKAKGDTADSKVG